MSLLISAKLEGSDINDIKRYGLLSLCLVYDAFVCQVGAGSDPGSGFHQDTHHQKMPTRENRVCFHHLIAEYKLSFRASDGQYKRFNISAWVLQAQNTPNKVEFESEERHMNL
jgi:hypothetical protein